MQNFENLDIGFIEKNKFKSILTFSVPAIISMVMTSLINVTDGFFMGNFIGKDAIAAVNLGLPIIYIYLAVGLMIGVGGSVISGISLGSGDVQKSKSVFNQTVATSAVVSFLLSVIFFFTLEPVAKVLNAQGKVAVYFRAYYMVLLLELPLMIINSVLGMFIRAQGNPALYMKVNTLTVTMNIVLDYIFAGPLALGVKGIAFASLVSAAAGTVIMILYFLKRSEVFGFQKFSFDKKIFSDTMLNGSSECIGELSMCISMFCYNFVIMRKFGADGVTAFTIVGYVAYVFSMIVVGFGQGVSPLISFAFGAKNKPLARSLRKRTSAMVFAAGVAVVLLLLFTSKFYSGIFVDDEKIQHMVQNGLMIFMTNFLLCGINAIASFYFTSIGKAKESALISFSRGFFVLLVSIFVLPVFFGMNGIWLSSPVTETVTLFITLLCLKKDK